MRDHHNPSPEYLYKPNAKRGKPGCSRTPRVNALHFQPNSSPILKFVNLRPALKVLQKSRGKTFGHNNPIFRSSLMLDPATRSTERKINKSPKNNIGKKKKTENASRKKLSVKKFFPFDFKDLARNRSRGSSAKRLQLNSRSFTSLTENRVNNFPKQAQTDRIRTSTSISMLKCLKKRERSKRDHLRRSQLRGASLLLFEGSSKEFKTGSECLRGSSIEKSLGSLSVLLDRNRHRDLFRGAQTHKRVFKNQSSMANLIEAPQKTVRTRNKGLLCFPFCSRKSKKSEMQFQAKKGLNSREDLKTSKKKDSSLIRLKNSLINIFLRKKKQMKEESERKEFEREFVGKLQDSIKKGKKLIEYKAKMARSKNSKHESSLKGGLSMNNHFDSKKTLKLSNLLSLVENDSMEPNKKGSQILNQNKANYKYDENSNIFAKKQKERNSKGFFYGQKKFIIENTLASPESHAQSSSNIPFATKPRQVESNSGSFKRNLEKKSTMDGTSFNGSFRSKMGSGGLIVNNFSWVYSKSIGSRRQPQGLDRIFDHSDLGETPPERSKDSVDFSRYCEQMDGRSWFELGRTSLYHGSKASPKSQRRLMGLMYPFLVQMQRGDR